MVDCNDLLHDSFTSVAILPEIRVHLHDQDPTRLQIRCNGVLVCDVFGRPVAFDLYETRRYLRQLGIASFVVAT